MSPGAGGDAGTKSRGARNIGFDVRARDGRPRRILMRQLFLLLFSALTLAGCISFSSSNPTPPPSSTVVVPRYY